MATSNRITVNAGGRRFETTRDTLLTSGASYFRALLGTTGAALGTLTGRDAGNGGAADAGVASSSSGGRTAAEIVTPPNPGRGTKRARGDEGEPGPERTSLPQGSASVAGEVFVDRDPDLFGDVLGFMRSGRLPAGTRRDVDRLEDLAAEADFFVYDELKSACEKSKEEVRAAIAKALEPESEPTAVCHVIVLDPEGEPGPQQQSEDFTVTVRKGEVLYIESATLAGPGCIVKRYSVTEEERNKHPKKEVGCYIHCDRESTGDFQLRAWTDSTWFDDDTETFTLAHVGLNHVHTDFESGLNVDFRQPLGICLSYDEDKDVNLYSVGSAQWNVLCWVGNPEAIPGLRRGEPAAKKRKLSQVRSSGDGGDGGDGGVLSTLTILMAGMATRTMAMAAGLLSTVR